MWNTVGYFRTGGKDPLARFERFTLPQEAMPARLSSFRLLAMASLATTGCSSEVIDMTHTSGIVSGADRRDILVSRIKVSF
jgi:hypothetical protein